jgi:hypothetical protein
VVLVEAVAQFLHDLLDAGAFPPGCLQLFAGFTLAAAGAAQRPRPRHG